MQFVVFSLPVFAVSRSSRRVCAKDARSVHSSRTLLCFTQCLDLLGAGSKALAALSSIFNGLSVAGEIVTRLLFPYVFIASLTCNGVQWCGKTIDCEMKLIVFLVVSLSRSLQNFRG